MYTDLKRTWAEIDLSALEHNYTTLRRRVQTKFLGVVKADAYGHGAVEVSRCLQDLGVDYLAVSSLDEARELRYNGIYRPILILGHTPPDQVPLLIANNITQAVTSEAVARAYEAKAARCGATLKVHIKLDTGMSRLGFVCDEDAFDETVEAVKRVCDMPHLYAEGVFTHFAVSDEEDEASRAYTEEQLRRFRRAIVAVESGGHRFDLRHCSNTGAVARWRNAWMDMVRPGLLLYGYGPYAKELGLKPVMRLKTVVNAIKHYSPGTTISYGRLYETDRPTRMGVLPIGYADGLLRILSNRYEVMTKDGPAPIRGRICMDMCMVDLTDLPGVGLGDEIELFGEKADIDVMADMASTIPYELTCNISRRVLRVYLKDGEVVGQRLKMN
ncbi:MAG: alanine racemase [Oscillospiraceae bacterium]|nr:alanine racemase [Oscillospiraceae bacterium]